MSKQDDGGPAFPADAQVDHANPASGFLLPSSQGMSLRDWFAGQALAGLNTWSPFKMEDYIGGHQDWPTIQKRKAEWAYAQADAMLDARAKKEPQA